MTAIGIGIAGGVLPGNIWPPAAGQNLLHFSEDFTQAPWTKSSVTVTADAASDPNGQLTADLLTFAAGGLVRQFITKTESAALQTTSCSVTTAWQRFQVTITCLSGNSYTFSVYLRADSPQTVSIQVQSTGTTAIRAIINDMALAAPTIYAWGAQLEMAATAGPYTPSFS